MTTYRFKYLNELYHAEEKGDVVVVRWYASEGHDEDGSVDYTPSVINAYIKDGTYVIVPDTLRIKTLEEIVPQDKAAAVNLFDDLVPAGSTVDVSSSHGLGTFRPVLETRKVGKVRVELVDDGFPLALREIAKVMTWAQTAKGYKDHDWQNLPNAQIQLAAAASRHRTDHITQHIVFDKPLLECVDPESKLVHKAHEAFGVLAQLELMLRERAE